MEFEYSFMNPTPLSRRAFLRAGALAAGASAIPSVQAAPEVSPSRRATSCIVLLLTGGPSQFETWDPKPDAQAEIRGPFRSIATSVTGIRVSEHLPRLASMAQRLAIVRSVHHDASPVHESGLQLLQTGGLCAVDADRPHFGTVLARDQGPKVAGAQSFVILPNVLANMGMNVSLGQGAGNLGAAFEPNVQSRFTHHLASADRDRYGKTAFGDACARSFQLVEQGTRCVVVNMFDSVYDRVTWDCHATAPSFPGTLNDYRRTLCPTFDRAFATLLDDLQQRGLLDETLVIAMGEMGRTPRLNTNGGRDHWTRCWSIALAGGGVRGGQVIGASDRDGAEPTNRPVTCGEVMASIYHAMGASAASVGVPIRELFE